MLEEAVQMIPQFGYPIVISLILMWYIKNEQDKMQQLLNELCKSVAELVIIIKGREEK